MSEGTRGGPILTREELEALLAGGVEEAGRDGERLAGRLPRSPRSASAEPGEALAEVRRAIEEGSRRWGKQMAGSYQRRITCSLIGWDELDTADVAHTLLDTDEVVWFRLEPGGACGFALLARPLFFALLALEFGAGESIGPGTTPTRAYSAIERRLLRRLVRSLLDSLQAGWSHGAPLRAEIGGTAGPQELLEAVADRVVVASLDVTALDAVGRVRVALPTQAFRAARAQGPAAADDNARRLRESVGRLPVRLRAEVGSSVLSVSEFAALRVGDQIEIRPSAPEGLVIRVEGKPVFRAIRGQVGTRLAVQTVNRI